jgi:hypothetical protein
MGHLVASYSAVKTNELWDTMENAMGNVSTPTAGACVGVEGGRLNLQLYYVCAYIWAIQTIGLLRIVSPVY